MNKPASPFPDPQDTCPMHISKRKQNDLPSIRPRNTASIQDRTDPIPIAQEPCPPACFESIAKNPNHVRACLLANLAIAPRSTPAGRVLQHAPNQRLGIQADILQLILAEDPLALHEMLLDRAGGLLHMAHEGSVAVERRASEAQEVTHGPLDDVGV